ncbi:MAG: hypothetical protein AABY46_04635 [Nitrospirota bacterium]
MRAKSVSLILGVLFILFSTNAYACLFSMTLSGSMPMGSSSSGMPSHEELPLPCPTVQCDVMASQKVGEMDCTLSSSASSLKALHVTQPDRSAPPLTHALRLPAAVPTPAAGIGRADDPPRPLSTVSLLLLHSTLLL